MRRELAALETYNKKAGYLAPGGNEMAYPDPIPELNAKEAQQFEKKLQKFELTATQKEFYAEARKLFPPPKNE